MNYRDLRDEFQRRVYPSRPNEWDIEDALCELEGLKEQHQQILLHSISAVWPVSHSLCFSFLKEGAQRAEKMDSRLLSEWLRRILSSYERGGLKQARAYMSDTDPASLVEEEEMVSALLSENLGRLVPYASGLSGLDVRLQASSKVYTDTETLFLPEKVVFFPDRRQNYLYYKLVVGLQTSFIVLGSFARNRFYLSNETEEGEKTKDGADVVRYFDQFERPQLAKDIYQLIELDKAFSYLKNQYPGLIRQTVDIRRELYLLRNENDWCGIRQLENWFAAIITPETPCEYPGNHIASPPKELAQADTEKDKLVRIYKAVETWVEGYRGFCFLPVMDAFEYVESENVRESRIEKKRKEFETLLSDYIIKSNHDISNNVTEGNEPENVEGAKIQPIISDNPLEPDKKTGSININNSAVELPEELQNLVSQLEKDLGAIPDSYVSAAFGLAGKGRALGQGRDEAPDNSVAESIAYDEWDYRRHGYRKGWCSLRERTLSGVQSDFVDNVLRKYRGTRVKIQRQFEMMRTHERFSRRRRHGDDIDIDAHIESLCDQSAGLPASDNVFVRLLRSERDIASMFLVDMSNSTEGWVGRAIKEALILLCEAMEIVGDRYGIYGFSGMRRMRSEVYKIKDIREGYTSQVRDRLAAIAPKEYTRMGPPIRHLTRHFAEIEARSRLLLILSDGKPEDYDDYKGQYAIEDTKKALAEARGKGIHPYCITIDAQAHDYLEHLFGRGNYTFVQKIEQLPPRLTEIYRLLTR